MILPCPIALNYSLYQILRDILEVGKKLLCVLRKAITTITKRWVVIVRTDSRIQAYTIDDVLGFQSLQFCISVQLIEVGHTEGKISICKEFNCLAED
jgi:hypothetical protein